MKASTRNPADQLHRRAGTRGSSAVFHLVDLICWVPSARFSSAGCLGMRRFMYIVSCRWSATDASRHHVLGGVAMARRMATTSSMGVDTEEAAETPHHTHVLNTFTQPRPQMCRATPTTHMFHRVWQMQS